jgi:hypothetical protein
MAKTMNEAKKAAHPDRRLLAKGGNGFCKKKAINKNRESPAAAT